MWATGSSPLLPNHTTVLSLLTDVCVWQSPNRFEELFEEMISFLEQTDHWGNTEVELATRGVRVASCL